MAGYISDDLEDTDYIAEDEDVSDDDELQDIISSKHAKFTAEQKAKQEALQGSRPWSAPPLMSPRPEAQRAKQAEAVSYADPEVVARANSLPRTEYEPPTVRTGLRSASSLPQSLAYLAPARPRSAGHAPQAPSGMGGSPLQDILEDSPLDESGQHTDANRDQAGVAPILQQPTMGSLSQQQSQADSVADEVVSIPDADPNNDLYDQVGKSVSQVPSRRATSGQPSDYEDAYQQEGEEEEEGEEGQRQGEGDSRGGVGRGQQDPAGFGNQQETGRGSHAPAAQDSEYSADADHRGTPFEDEAEEEQVAGTGPTASQQHVAGWSEGAGEASLRLPGGAWPQTRKPLDEIRGDAFGTAGGNSSYADASQQQQQQQPQVLQTAVHVPTTHEQLPAQVSLLCVEPQAACSTQDQETATQASGSTRGMPTRPSAAAATEYGQLLHPHDFATALLQHDLQTCAPLQSSRSPQPAWGEFETTADDVRGQFAGQQEQDGEDEHIVEAQSEATTAATDYGPLMHPSSFALQLLNHDLSVMPKLVKQAQRQRPSTSQGRDPGGWAHPGGQPRRAGRPQSAPGPNARRPAAHIPYGMHGVDSILQPKQQGKGRRQKRGNGAPLPPQPPQYGMRQAVQPTASDVPLVSDEDAPPEMLHCDSARSRGTGQRRSSGYGDLGGWAQVLKRGNSGKAVRPSTAPSGGRAAWAYSSDAVPQRPPASPPAGQLLMDDFDNRQQPWWASSPYLPASYRAAGVGRPGHKQRPASAHPTFGRAGAGGFRASAPDGFSQDMLGVDGDITGGIAGGFGHQLASTAAVDVGGTQVSVYVADTVRKVKEANRYMAALGLRNRYRLKDHHANMLLQVYDSSWCPSSNSYAWSPNAGYLQPHDTDAQLSAAEVQAYAPTVREVTLQSFLVTHARLRSQVPRY